MKITIDTKEDTAEEIEKAIRILSAAISRTRYGFTEPQLADSGGLPGSNDSEIQNGSVDTDLLDPSVEKMAESPGQEGKEVEAILNGSETGEEGSEATFKESQNPVSVESDEVSGVLAENKVESVITPEPTVVEDVKRDKDTKVIPY